MDPQTKSKTNPKLQIHYSRTRHCVHATCSKLDFHSLSTSNISHSVGHFTSGQSHVLSKSGSAHMTSNEADPGNLYDYVYDELSFKVHYSNFSRVFSFFLREEWTVRKHVHFFVNNQCSCPHFRTNMFLNHQMRGCRLMWALLCKIPI